MLIVFSVAVVACWPRLSCRAGVAPYGACDALALGGSAVALIAVIGAAVVDSRSGHAAKAIAGSSDPCFARHRTTGRHGSRLHGRTQRPGNARTPRCGAATWTHPASLQASAAPGSDALSAKRNGGFHPDGTFPAGDAVRRMMVFPASNDPLTMAALEVPSPPLYLMWAGPDRLGSRRKPMKYFWLGAFHGVLPLYGVALRMARPAR